MAFVTITEYGRNFYIKKFHRVIFSIQVSIKIHNCCIRSWYGCYTYVTVAIVTVYHLIFVCGVSTLIKKFLKTGYEDYLFLSRTWRIGNDYKFRCQGFAFVYLVCLVSLFWKWSWILSQNVFPRFNVFWHQIM